MSDDFVFANAATISDDNEFSLEPVPLYVTMKEANLIGASIPLFYLAGAWSNSSFIPVATMVAGAVSFALFLNRHRKGKPASWIFDFQLAMGWLPVQRCLLKVKRKPFWLMARHVPKPSTYISGSNKPGRDLSMSAPWMLYAPPLIDSRRLIPPRVRFHMEEQSGPGPANFAGAIGHEKVITPKLWFRLQPELQHDVESVK